MGEGSRESTMFEYANRLMEFGFTSDQLAECLVFINEHVIGKPLSDDEVANIHTQMTRMYARDNTADNVTEDSITMELFNILSGTNFDNSNVNTERFIIKYLDAIYEDTILLNDEILIREDNSYNYHSLSELENIITNRIEEATSSGYAVEPFVNAIKRAIRRRKVITRYEYEKVKTPDNIIVFKNGFFDINSEMFSSEERVGEINLKVLATKYNPNPNPEMKTEVKNYLMSLANNHIGTYKNIRDMLGTILIKDTKLYKALFILYGSKGGNNGKSTLFELLHDVIGKSSVSTTSMDQMIARFGLAPLDNTILTTCGEIGEEVTSGYEIIKAATGGDELPLEKKGQDQYMGKLTTTLIFASNHRTKFTNAQGDGALNKRARFIDFANEFDKNDIDHEFDVRLLKDPEFKEAFLHEMIEAMIDLKSRNFNFHPYANQSPTDYINKVKKNSTKADLVASFVEVELPGSCAYGIKKTIMWKIFEDYVSRTPHTQMPTQKEFELELYNTHGIEYITMDTSIRGKRLKGRYSNKGLDLPEEYSNTLSEFRVMQQKYVVSNSKGSVYSEEDLI